MAIMKKLITLILSIFLLFSCSSYSTITNQNQSAVTQSSNRNANVKDKRYIGIIVALNKEIEVFVKNIELERTDEIGGCVFYVGKLSGKDVVIVKAGKGKVLSSAGVATMLNNYAIDSVVFSGIAGGVGKDINVLDIVVATDLIEHDYGKITDNDSGSDYIFQYEGKPYYCDKNLVNLAYNGGKRCRRNA